jgi:hypothetical protein
MGILQTPRDKCEWFARLALSIRIHLCRQREGPFRERFNVSISEASIIGLPRMSESEVHQIKLWKQNDHFPQTKDSTFTSPP